MSDNNESDKAESVDGLSIEANISESRSSLSCQEDELCGEVINLESIQVIKEESNSPSPDVQAIDSKQSKPVNQRKRRLGCGAILEQLRSGQIGQDNEASSSNAGSSKDVIKIEDTDSGSPSPTLDDVIITGSVTSIGADGQQVEIIKVEDDEMDNQDLTVVSTVEFVSDRTIDRQFEREKRIRHLSEVATSRQRDDETESCNGRMNRKERRAQKFTEKTVVVEDIVDETNRQLAISTLLSAPEYAIYIESSSFSNGAPQFNKLIPSNNYVKKCSFSPNGQFISTVSQDRKCRVFKMENDEKLNICGSVGLGDAVYDCVWHPSGDLLATTSKNHPIHLWDSNCERQASYRGINHLDELSAAHTMEFSLNGLRMYAGYQNCIRIWDVKAPGRQAIDIKTWTKRDGGQKCFINCLAVHPLYDGVYAAAGTSNTIGIYSDRTNSLDCMFSGDFSSVSQIIYSSDGMKLYSVIRKSDLIYCWDMRYTGKHLFTMERPFTTNQKTNVALSKDGGLLFSGTSDGTLVTFNLYDGDDKKLPIFTRQVTPSTVPSVSIHPYLSLAAVCTGERVFPFPMIDDEDDPNEVQIIDRPYLNTNQQSLLHNTLQLWKLD